MQRPHVLGLFLGLGLATALCAAWAGCSLDGLGLGGSSPGSSGTGGSAGAGPTGGGGPGGGGGSAGAPVGSGGAGGGGGGGVGGCGGGAPTCAWWDTAWTRRRRIE